MSIKQTWDFISQQEVGLGRLIPHFKSVIYLLSAYSCMQMFPFYVKILCIVAFYLLTFNISQLVMVSCLFIGKNKEDCISQFIFSQHPHQLLSCFIHTLSVITVHHKDETWNSRNNMLILFWWRRRELLLLLDWFYPLMSSAYPVCFESSVSREGESCPAHLHPTQWSWCSCTPPSLH